jgi:hypothetical protein
VEKIFLRAMVMCGVGCWLLGCRERMLEDNRMKVLRQVGAYLPDEAAHGEGKGDTLAAVTFNLSDDVEFDLLRLTFT